MNVCKRVYGSLASMWDARKLGALVLCSVLLMGTTIGCTSQQVANVVKNIAIYAQEAQPILTNVLALIAAFGSSDTSTASTMTQIQSDGNKIKTDLADLVALCNSYTSHPSADVWTQIIALVDDLVSNGDSALTDLTGIKSSTSQQTALAVLASLSALLHTIDGLVQSTQSQAQVKATAQKRTLKLKTVSQYWSEQDKANIAKAFGTNYSTLYQYESQMGY